MSWDGDLEHGMKCIACVAEGKTDGAFTDAGGCCVFMVKNCVQHHKHHHLPKIKVGTPASADATAAARSVLGAAAAEAGSSASKT